MDRRRCFVLRPESVAEARHFVTWVLADVPVDLQVAELLTSELATNAVNHAKTDFAVRVTERAACARIEITNDAPEMLAAIRAPDDNGGRGLRLVNTLSSSWGTQEGQSEKTVWFELAHR